MSEVNEQSSSNKDADESNVNNTLTDKQRAKIERNRQRALLLRSARLTSHPYASDGKKLISTGGGGRMIDSGGGFLLEPEDDEHDEEISNIRLVEQPAPIIDGSEDRCSECFKQFSDSYLMKNFDVQICDGCRDWEKHKLITKTDAKQTYCLKDCDFDMRQPTLKFIIRKNPHNDRWGDMKLYYMKQVHKRSMEIWGSEEKLEEQKEHREEHKEKLKCKRFEKRIKDLRQAVRTSTWHKDLSKHEHEYDSENETYDEEDDVFTKKCKTCEHAVTYEKM